VTFSTTATAGIDGCRAGWLICSADGAGIEWMLARTSSELRVALLRFERVFIDMPIGLPDQEPGRDCDQELRRALGWGFSSSVFSPPCREALYATDYPSASQINARQTGKKLSIQSWNLIPKIRQLDEILQHENRLRDRIFESHPEWLFQLAGRQSQKGNGVENIQNAQVENSLQDSTKQEDNQAIANPLQFKKKSKEGVEERLHRLSSEIEVADEAFEEALTHYRRKDVAKDDILDAMILAVMAEKSRMGWEDEPATLEQNMQFRGLQAFPRLSEDGRLGGVQRDSTGLFKAIWYPAF